MNQSFNRQQLLRLCKQAEYIDYGMTINQLSDNLDTAYNEITNDDYEFVINQVGEYFLTPDLPSKLILRKLNDNIRRIYKDKQANRRMIIAQIKTLLSETCPYWIIKTDIRRFYESIDRERIISKFHDDSMLSYQSMHLLKKVFDNPLLSTKTGVPRGMNISATLSEIYMRKFDKWIRIFDSVYYYARFVDDIIIFSNSLASSINLISHLNSKLAELADGLEINNLKTELYDGITLKSLSLSEGKLIRKPKPLDYLGYSFVKEKEYLKRLSPNKFQNVEDLKYTTDERYSTSVRNKISQLEFNSVQNPKLSQLKVSIAGKKVKKIKTRIVQALFDFSKNRDFVLLENRIKFLSGNYSIKKGEKGNDLRAGIYYNYLQVNELKVFNELNSFFRKALFSRAPSFGTKISLTPIQKRRLNKYCFVAGFKNRVYNEFTFDEMNEIVNCW